MFITKEAKTFIQSLQTYLPNPKDTTYQLLIEDSYLSLVPTAATSFAQCIYDEEQLLLGLDAPTQKHLQGRTLILKRIGKTVTLELLERRRKPRESLA